MSDSEVVQKMMETIMRTVFKFLEAEVKRLSRFMYTSIPAFWRICRGRKSLVSGTQ